MHIGHPLYIDWITLADVTVGIRVISERMLTAHDRPKVQTTQSEQIDRFRQSSVIFPRLVVGAS